MRSNNGRPRLLRHSIQTELAAMYLGSMLLVFAINLYLFSEINLMIGRIDSVFSSNADLASLQGTLEQVQTNLTDYLNTKSSDSMEAYYRSQQAYSEAVAAMDSDVHNNAEALLEKDIRGMSGSYLTLTDAAIEAKRGRKVESYNALYGQASELYGYLNTCMYSLNNSRFESNSLSYGALLRSFQAFEIVDSVLLSLTAVTNVLLAVFLMRRITHPLEQLAVSANTVASGNLAVPPLEVSGHNEVSVLSTAFNQMVVSLRSNLERLEQSMAAESALREKELMMENHLKEAQLQTLQAQINPHFLFNTLNAGAQLAMMEGADRTYSYVQNVADFFRYNVQRANGSTTLGEELDLVDHYLYIVNVRYGGEIRYECRADASLAALPVPSMILQPLVENCIKHGLRDAAGEKRILLTVQRTAHTAEITVQDNGKGMLPEEIARVLRSEAIPAREGGVGLRNVAMRLRLYFGQEDVLALESGGPGRGLTVLLHLPLEEGRNHV